MGQGDLATKNAVDLATSEVTNRTADNIAETETRKWAGETGADVTADHEAASIVGQGDLATKNAVDLATSEVTNKALANLDTTVTGTELNSIKSDVDGATNVNTANKIVKRNASGNIDISQARTTSVKVEDSDTLGALNIQYEKQTVSATGGSVDCHFSKLIQGVRLLGCQIFPEGVTGPATYTAAYITGNTQSICTATNVGTQVAVSYDDNASSSKSSGTTDVQIASTGVEFSAGTFTVIVYFIDFTSMSK